jgi:type IV pilus assembly protein PilO
MPRSFEFSHRLKGVSIKDPRVLARLMLGLLLAANLAAAIVAFKPFGGSAEDLMRQEQALRRELQEFQVKQARTRALVEKVQLARKEGDQFLSNYLLDRRSTMSSIEEELTRTAKEAGIKRGQTSFALDPVEGSETLSHKSPRFLIIERMVAAPQVGGQNLNVSLQLDAFVRDSAGGAL